MTCALMKGGNFNRETDMHTGEMPCKYEGRDRGDASTSQGNSSLPENHQNLAK